MAVIGRIRSYSGMLLAFVGIALAAFVMGDLFKARVRTPDKLADINGERISYRVFASRVDEQVYLRELNTQQKVTQDQHFQIMSDTWRQLVSEVLIRQQCEAIGLAFPTERNGMAGIHPEELVDQIQGDQPHNFILQNFSDPQTGQLNRDLLNQFVENLEQLRDQDENTYKQWLNLERMIAVDRLRAKYFNLIESSFFMPDAFAQQRYMEQNRVAKVRIVSQRITTVDDSLITVDDEQLRKYYDKNVQNYKQKASREIKYVQFDIQPSETDIREAETDIANMRAQLVSSEDPGDAVNEYSDEPYDSTYFKRGELSLYIDSLMFSVEPGYVTDVYYENEAYRTARLIDRTVRPDSVRFSHIFLAYRGANPNITSVRSKEQSESLADSLFSIVSRDPSRFDSLAIEFSDDTETADFGGDVNWLLDIPGNKLVDACVNNPIGHMEVVETAVGYHVLKVTDKTSPEAKVRVAVMTRSIVPSESTYNQIYTQASEFVAKAATLDEFMEAGNELNPRTAEIRDMDPQVSVLPDSRSIVRWAFEPDRELGDVSDVFELNDKLIVAVVSKIREEGTTPFEEKKEDLRPLVLNELKGEYLLEQFSAEVAGMSDLGQIAAKLNSKVDSNDFITFASFSLPGYGPEPEVIGTIFSMQPGQVSEPIKGRSGVFVVIVDEFVEPQQQENPDYSSAVMTYQSAFKSRVQNELMSILEEISDIEDNREVYF